MLDGIQVLSHVQLLTLSAGCSLLVIIDHFLDHLSAYASSLAGSEVTIVTLFQGYAYFLCADSNLN